MKNNLIYSLLIISMMGFGAFATQASYWLSLYTPKTENVSTTILLAVPEAKIVMKKQYSSAWKYYKEYTVQITEYRGTFPCTVEKVDTVENKINWHPY